MNLLLLRRDFTDKSTIGLLYAGQVLQCYALEDPDRKLEDGGEKIPGKTAIPRGKYRIIIDWSNRFKRELPRLLDVPNYVGVRIHPGNGPEDTEGCILPGTGIPSNRQDWLLNSRAAFDALFNKIEAALELGEEVWIEVA